MNQRKLVFVVAIVAVAFVGGWLWAGQAPAESTETATVSVPAGSVDGVEVVMYQNPACGCCGKWAAHMEEAGFVVDVRKTAEVNRIKEQHGITAATAACHTAIVDGYVVEGHVPAADVVRLLEERPDVLGITVPGMPMGSPGMEGDYSDPYDVLTYDAEGNTAVFASH